MRTFCLVLLCFLSTLAFADQPQAKRITGIYSNLSYNNESGDLSGMEIIILPSRHGPDGGYSAFVQISEGGAPSTAIVPLKVTGANIDFTLPADSEYPGEHLVGNFKGVELILKWSSGNEEHLKRGKSYWQ